MLVILCHAYRSREFVFLSYANSLDIKNNVFRMNSGPLDSYLKPEIKTLPGICSICKSRQRKYNHEKNFLDSEWILFPLSLLVLWLRGKDEVKNQGSISSYGQKFGKMISPPIGIIELNATKLQQGRYNTH